VTVDGGMARVDGRTARAQRTRRAIVDALLALTAEGDLKASPERIVERAGVSLRTLWTNFKDLEGLYAAASDRLIELQEHRHRPIPVDAGLPERVAAFCAQRATMLEIIAPAARAAQLRLPYSAQLRRNRAVHTARGRDEIDIVFAPELRAAGPGREELVRALLLNTTWPAWSMLRDDLGLNVSAATAVMSRAVAALLGSPQA
jgi:TetR/AcrR family transcriptional regulator, regulator of autoinduction and epiphytic fitness